MANEPRSPIAEPETAALNTASRYRDGAPTDREIIHTRREIVSRSCAVAKECGGVTGKGRNQAIAVPGRLPDGPDWSGSMGPSQVLAIESGRPGAFPPKVEGRPQPARHGADCRTNIGVRPGWTRPGGKQAGGIGLLGALLARHRRAETYIGHTGGSESSGWGRG